ncbi:3D-(3,5/4)-trihydroxycyclohexane-1,2-dione acylhydrolase (decyclizing) [Pseudorhodoplanes sinuspersici]|uniref:Thiamine pyrophosphate-binding protein n=2 Tax=Pseudorhodoplanes sinuspersici TaxID=1235591 RepID=A0A1W6ZZW1_9HYPH|nr:thiamine pyrophosphate-binding protein [Pseudorhodoplanes sinuspersici]RKE70331.1 3D-(3,5/4)-trihydroxycyclohexane-1,2-dione acylhydrolase (decyclizing) [Pseudorhodoplanes sinuspersici]
MRARARAINEAGGLTNAIESAALPKLVDATLSEALVLGLLKQGVRKYLGIFGHGSTDLGDVLRIYEEEGVTRTFNFRNEVEMAHAATALRWQYGEIPAVVTSIGPGALQAFAGSLASASNGVGVYHIYGDETTFGEGYNMQQVPKEEQGLFGRMTALMGGSYVLHTPEALRDALRRGSLAVNHPYRAGPFYLLLPLNTQPQRMTVNLAALPARPDLPALAPVDDHAYAKAARLIAAAPSLAIKAGGGTRGHDAAVRKFAEAAGAAVVLSPGSTGVLPDAHPQNMHVGGSKGSISGNFAMANAELVVVIGSRAVCQADCSGIGYKAAKHVININGDFADALHYNQTTVLAGDITAVIERLCAHLKNAAASKSVWLQACAEKKKEWIAFKQARFDAKPAQDPVWQQPVLYQPAAIKVVADFAKRIDAAKFFDAGDVQANGFQIVEDDRTGDTFTETGASYMGFAVSGLLASGITDKPRYSIAFTGDGSFMMNPQVLIDAVEHRVRGMIVIFDNRRMAAITGLQLAQYGREFRTSDSVAVDYVQLASSVNGVRALHGGLSADELRAALKEAHAHDGLSVVHVPVYAGPDELAGLGAWGQWNVGNWCADVQREWIEQDI